MVKVKRVLGIIVILALLIGSGAPFFASMSPALAQDGETFQLAPLNPDFVDFLEHPPELSYGYRPPTMDLSHLKEIPVQRARALPAQPAAFDWRDQGKVTPVKDQNPCGTCWIFGPTSVLESTVLLGESVEYNFSEQSVALCVDRSWVYLYDHADEPCGTVPGHGGGDSFMASEVFIKKGAILESCNPYDTDGLQCNGTCACDSCPPVKKVTGYRRVTDDGSQIALIKSAVYSRPVTMSFFYDSSGEYTDPTYGAIYDYYPCDEDANHLVSIIGWDDSVPHPDPDHSGNGAWLVKNSWGTADSWAGGAGISDGYFWLAYDSSSMTGIAYLEYGDYNANETLYYWDEAGLVNWIGAGSTSLWMASIFTSEQDGDLTHVDFWTTSNDAAYEIYVYDGSFGSQLASETGSCDELGYYSIPLTTPVSVTNGQQFTVAVKMTTPGWDYPLPVEYEIPGVCEPPIQPGVCFLSTDGSTWDDAAYILDGLNVCLRAKVTTEPAPNSPPEVTNITASQGSGIVDITYNVSDAEQSQVGISFEYWDGASWWACITTTGEGTQSIGTGKSGTWNAKTDRDELYMPDCRIRVTADDGQAENNIGSGESNAFTLDTKDPTGYGCSTPTDGATDVSITPNLTCLTASDDSPPIFYYFQLAENDTFSQGLQESGWQSSTTWSPSTLSGETQYFWRVKAKDNYANETDYSSTFNFTPTVVSTYDVPLVTGWNLISLPLIPDSANIEDILEDIMSDIVAVWAYDGATGEWHNYNPIAPPDLTEMTDGNGYWVRVTNPCTLTIEGEQPLLPYDIPLFSNWNLIGLPLIAEPRPIEDILEGIMSDIVAVWAYDGATGEWHNYNPIAPPDLTEMTDGNGYWVRVTNPCTLTIEPSLP